MAQEPINITPKKPIKYLKSWILLGLLAIVLLVLLPECIYIVGESEQALISRFGVITDIIVSPRNDFHTRNPGIHAKSNVPLENVTIRHATGLMFKLPFIDKVEKFSSRLYTYQSDSEIVNTAEKKQYFVTTFAQWSIADPALFSLAFGTTGRAENYLDNLIHPVIVQSINRLMANDFISNKDALNTVLSTGMSEINRTVNLSGIDIVDVQIHRTILPPANLESTYARMTANRAKVAQQLRSEGDEEYTKSMSSADLEARRIEADALSEAGRIRGEADAKALEIYADAYGKDEEFYTYWRSLQALEASLTDGTTLVLDREHPLWKDLLTWIGE